MSDPIRVSSECREKLLILSQYLSRIAGHYEIDPENPQVIIPCEILNDDIAEPLINVFLRSPPQRHKEVIIAVDPGEAKTGLVMAANDEILYASSTTPETFRKIFQALSRYYARVILFIGNTPAAHKLLEVKPPNVVVEFLDESKLPIPHTDIKSKDDVLDALGIYLKGRALLIMKAISNNRRMYEEK
ncbi:hypothetical protein [Infirmifilum uzonense]|uniref:hypothetical protein n=1 Tax=Infirmifilum uzonense TaxID=1550241 RepID=UPI00235307E2